MPEGTDWLGIAGAASGIIGGACGVVALWLAAQANKHANESNVIASEANTIAKEALALQRAADRVAIRVELSVSYSPNPPFSTLHVRAINEGKDVELAALFLTGGDRSLRESVDHRGLYFVDNADHAKLAERLAHGSRREWSIYLSKAQIPSERNAALLDCDCVCVQVSTGETFFSEAHKVREWMNTVPAEGYKPPPPGTPAMTWGR